MNDFPEDGLIRLPPPDPVLTHLARKNMIFRVKPEEAGWRLDQYAARQSGLDLDLVRALISFGAVWLDAKACNEASIQLAAAQQVTLQAPLYGPVRFYEANPKRIIFRDKWLLAYDKEANIPCQQTPYDGYNNLFAALKRRNSGYLALHHRLDAPTSGVMLFARDRKANSGLSLMFKQGRIQKTYLAVVKGKPEQESWTCDLPVAKKKGGYHLPPDGRGKPARTEFQVLASLEGQTLIQARPLTGRTHQIRLHLTAGGLPIIGDTTYGGYPAPRLLLHAFSLAFDHPLSGDRVVIETPAPYGFDFNRV